MMARSLMLQLEAGYIDARPLTANSSKSSCYARPDHTFGSKADITGVGPMSALPPKADIDRGDCPKLQGYCRRPGEGHPYRRDLLD